MPFLARKEHSMLNIPTTVPVAPSAWNLYNKVSGTQKQYEVPTNNDNLTNATTDFSGNLDYKRTLQLLEKEQQFNREQAQISRDWQERMSNTAYQRATQDLRKAGYNPALIVGQGGASTPSGATAYSTSKQSHNTSINTATLYQALINGAFKLASSFVSGLFFTK
jgi:hypothetical protein